MSMESLNVILWTLHLGFWALLLQLCWRRWLKDAIVRFGGKMSWEAENNRRKFEALHERREQFHRPFRNRQVLFADSTIEPFSPIQRDTPHELATVQRLSDAYRGLSR